MKVVILAGGKGIRMGPLTKDIPKPMVLLDNKPILEYQIELIRKYGLNDITILTGYKGDVIRDYFKTGKKFIWIPSIYFLTNMNRFNSSSHEWIGLIAYYIMGRTNKIY